MPKIAYRQHRFGAKALATIQQANDIIEEYAAQGFDLTLRQLYYQFVARAYIPNRDREYSKLGGVINDARLAGLIDWNAISDRTRSLKDLSHWSTPDDLIDSAARSYRRDIWALQTYRPEVWIEKDALTGVIAKVCTEADVPYFSCRGYTSQSEMWVASRRLSRWARAGQLPIILHFGDHDPSGLDMTRDIDERLAMFSGPLIEVRRLALNMDQVKLYNPPPNPAKITDSRFEDYAAQHGEESWELDSMEPRVLAGLIEDQIEELKDEEQWRKDEEKTERQKVLLHTTAERWAEVETFLDGKGRETEQGSI